MSEKKPRATIDQAKAAWEAHPEPSIRTVIAALDEAGLFCSVATMQRWHKAGWVLKGKTRNAKDVQAEAQAAVKKGVERQDDKTLTRLDQIAAEEAAMKDRAAELEKVEQDSELARMAMRKSLIAQIVLSEQIIRRAVYLTELAPDKVPKIIEALKGPAASTTIVIPATETPPAADGEGAKVIDGRVLPEPSSTQLAIERFQRQQRERVPA